MFYDKKLNEMQISFVNPMTIATGKDKKTKL